MRHTNVRAEMPFLDHLEEMRWRILKSLAALLVGVVGGFLVVHYLHVTELLVRPIRPYLGSQGGRLAAFSPVTPFLLELKLSIIVGVLLAFPVIAGQIWAFLSPALEKHERRVIVPSLYMGLMLFILGAMLAYFILPLCLRVLLTRFQAEYLNMVIGADEYLRFTVRLMLAFGAVFELPVVLMILSALGLVSPTILREKRRYAIVIMAALSAILTPADVFSMMVLFVPFLVLYESSILLSAMVFRGRENRNRLLDEEEPPEGAVEASP